MQTERHILTIQGSRFAIAGTFKEHTQSEIAALIVAAGGSISSRVSEETDYLLTGKDEQSLARNTALLLGIPIPGEEELFRALGGEEVILQTTEDEADTDSRALFGEVRSLLHEAIPSREAWEALTALLDKCTPEQLEPLIYYTGEHLKQWERDGQMKELVGSTYDLGDPREDAELPRGRKRGVAGEVRVAPERWVGEMLQGNFSVKHGLVRALDLASSGLNGTRICALLDNPHMTTIERIVLPTSKKITKKLLRRLCEPPLLDTVCMLRLGDTPHFHPTFDDWLSEHGQQQGALRELDLTDYRAGMSPHTLRLPYFERIEALWFYQQHLRGWDISDIPPKLKHLHLINPTSDDVTHLMGWKWELRDLRALSIHDWSTPFWFDVLDHDFPGHLELLEIDMEEGLWEHLTWGQKNSLRESVYNSPLLCSVDVFQIGKVKNELGEQRLAQRFPNLEVR